MIPNQEYDKVVLSPLLYIDLVIKEVHGINDNDEQFILAHADDIAQTATTKEELEKCMTTWNTASSSTNSNSIL